MVRLGTILLIALKISTLSAQALSDKEAIAALLKMEDISGKYSWEFDSNELKQLGIKMLRDTSVTKTKKGVSLLSYGFTSKTYDDVNDRIFLKYTLGRTSRLDSLFEDAAFIPSHFLKSDYDKSDRKKISFYSSKQSLLYWKSYMPYYLSFLEIERIDSTLLFLKENIESINHLHYQMHSIAERFDSLDINICLARLGYYNDTTIVSQVEEKFHSSYIKDYQDYFQRLSRIRSSLAFHKIGHYLVSELNEIQSEEKRRNVKQMALAAFLAYVKNFLDRSTKWQDTFNLWQMVRYSRFHGKDYSTSEYMSIAKSWYLDNKDNLVLDYDKY